MLLLTNKTVEKLQHDLVRENLVDMDKLILAQDTAEKNGTTLAEELINENLISEIELLNFIQDKLHIPFVDLRDYTPDKNCQKYVSAENAQKYNIFPLFKIEDVLTIAMSDPLDLFTINNLFEMENIAIEPVVCSENSIKKAIGDYYFNEHNEEKKFWQDRLISDNITDDILAETIEDIIKDAIDKSCEHIYMERSKTGLNIYFTNDLAGYIPNIVVPRFLYMLSNIANFDNDNIDIPQTSRFQFFYNKNSHIIISSIFPTKFGARISLLINKPIKNIEYYDKLKDKLSIVLEKPSLIGIEYTEQQKNAEFVYALAEYLSLQYSVLIVESNIKYELNNVAQVEFHKNTAIYFDEILNQIDLQKFDIVFWEKIYTKEQAEKLKLLSKERTIITTPISVDNSDFDFVISKDGKFL